MYQSAFGHRYINGYRVDIFAWDDVTECITYEIKGKIRKAKRHYTKAALGFGNPPPGTRLEYYQIILPNGKKVNYNIYAQEDRKMKFTNEELFIISDGLIALIQNNSQAIKLTTNKKAQKAIQKTIEELQALNSKTLNMIEFD